MTHTFALDRSRNLLDHRADCTAELDDLGPDPSCLSLRLWSCTACQVAIAIDPTGAIRDVTPLVHTENRLRIFQDARPIPLTMTKRHLP